MLPHYKTYKQVNIYFINLSRVRGISYIYFFLLLRIKINLCIWCNYILFILHKGVNKVEK